MIRYVVLRALFELGRKNPEGSTRTIEPSESSAREWAEVRSNWYKRGLQFTVCPELCKMVNYQRQHCCI